MLLILGRPLLDIVGFWHLYLLFGTNFGTKKFFKQPPISVIIWLVQLNGYKGGRLISRRGGEAYEGKRCDYLDVHVWHVHLGIAYLRKKIDRPA